MSTAARWRPEVGALLAAASLTAAGYTPPLVEDTTWNETPDGEHLGDEELHALEEVALQLLEVAPRGPRVHFLVVASAEGADAIRSNGATVFLPLRIVRAHLADPERREAGKRYLAFAFSHEIAHAHAPPCVGTCGDLLQCERRIDDAAFALLTRAGFVASPRLLDDIASAQRSTMRDALGAAIDCQDRGDRGCSADALFLASDSGHTSAALMLRSMAVVHARATRRDSSDWSGRQLERELMTAFNSIRASTQEVLKSAGDLAELVPPDSPPLECLRVRRSSLATELDRWPALSIPAPTSTELWTDDVRWRDDADWTLRLAGGAVTAATMDELGLFRGLTRGAEARAEMLWQGGWSEEGGLRFGLTRFAPSASEAAPASRLALSGIARQRMWSWKDRVGFFGTIGVGVTRFSFDAADARWDVGVSLGAWIAAKVTQRVEVAAGIEGDAQMVTRITSAAAFVHVGVHLGDYGGRMVKRP